MKTIRGLASALAKMEGKKSQARIGDIRELLGLLADLMYEEDIRSDYSTKNLLFDLGYKRAKKKKK